MNSLRILTISLLLLLFFLFVWVQWDGSSRISLLVVDLLPLLPRQVSWPLLRSLHGAADLLPTFVGSPSLSNTHVEWKGACFYQNSAWMEFHNKSGSKYGGGTLHIKVCFHPNTHKF